MAIHHLSLLIVVVLCLAMNHVPPSMQQDEKPPEPSVKDILTELKSGKRYVFAAGFDGTKMLLFISGNEASIAFGSGLQVESPGEPVNGSFAHLEKAKNLSKYPSAKFSADELVFAVKDSKGIELVGMSKQGVNVLSLSSGSFDHLKITEDVNIENCYRRGALHISSSDAGTFYVLDSKGNLGKVNFDNVDSVVVSETCLEHPLGQLCLLDKKITLSKSCKDPPPKDVVSGLVTSGSAYLFTKTGDLYLFSASLFKQSSGSVDVTVVKAEEAWPTGGGASSSAKPPAPTTGSSSSMLYIYLAVPVGVLICSSAFAYCFIKQNQPKKSKDAQPSSSIGSFKRQVTAVNQRDHGLDSKQQQDRSRSRSLKGGARTETGAGPSTGKQQQQPRGESEGGASAPAADLPGAPHYHLNVIVRPKQGKDSEKYGVDGPYGNSTLSEALHDGEDPGTEAAAEAALKSKNLPDDTEMTMEYQSHSHSDVGPPPPPPTSSKAQTPKSAKKKKTKESKRKKSKKGRGGSKKSKQKKKTKSKKKDSLKKTASKQSKQSKQSKKHRGSAKKGSGQKKSSVKKSKVQGSAKKKTGGSSQKKAGAASSASRKGGSSAKQQPQQQTTMMASKKSAKGQTSSAKGQNSSSANKK